MQLKYLHPLKFSALEISEQIKNSKKKKKSLQIIDTIEVLTCASINIVKL